MFRPVSNMIPNTARGIKKIYLMLRGLYYSGSTYKCNLCGNTFRSMLKGGFDLDVIKEKQIVGAGLRNHICPFCQSTDRDRLVKLFLDTKKDITSNTLKVLHIAPEPSLYNYFSTLENLSYIPAAKYHEGIYYPKNMSLVDLTDMDFPDNEFDIIICNHVLEHIKDDNLAMHEIYRTLRKGGFAILQVPYSLVLNETYENDKIILSAEREKYFGQFDHVRLYGLDYSNKLKNSGFIVEEFISPNKIDNQTLKLFDGEKLFVVNKPN